MADTDKVNCEKCHKIINSRTGKPLVCDGECKLVFHSSCVNIDSKKYNDITKNNTIFWFCDMWKKTNRTQKQWNNEANTPNYTTKSSYINFGDIQQMLYTLQKNILQIKEDMKLCQELAEMQFEENKLLRKEKEKLK